MNGKRKNYLRSLSIKELAEVFDEDTEIIYDPSAPDEYASDESDEDKEILFRISEGLVPSPLDDHDSDEFDEDYAYLGKDYSYDDDMKEDWDALTRADAMSEARVMAAAEAATGDESDDSDKDDMKEEV